MYQLHIDIETRSQNSYTAPYNGVVNHGALIGGIQIFAAHTRGNKRKQNVSTIFFVPLGISRVSIFTLRPQFIMHLTNRGYFDRVKNPNTLNLSPILE